MAFSSTSRPDACRHLQPNLEESLSFAPSVSYHEVKNWITNVHVADIDQDGDREVLAGSRDGCLFVFSKEGILLGDHNISDHFLLMNVADTIPDEPDITALLSLPNDRLRSRLNALGVTLELTNSQLHLLRGFHETTYGAARKRVRLALAEIQVYWGKEQMGYRRALCLLGVNVEQQRTVVTCRTGSTAVIYRYGATEKLQKKRDPLEQQRSYLRDQRVRLERERKELAQKIGELENQLARLDQLLTQLDQQEATLVSETKGIRPAGRRSSPR